MVLEEKEKMAKVLGEMKDQIDFGELLKDGSVLCALINALQPGSVKKINTLPKKFQFGEKIVNAQAQYPNATQSWALCLYGEKHYEARQDKVVGAILFFLRMSGGQSTNVFQLFA